MKEKQGMTTLIQCQQPELRDLFPSFLNERLSAEQSDQIEQHISECSECQEEISFWMALFEQDLLSWCHTRPDGHSG